MCVYIYIYIYVSLSLYLYIYLSLSMYIYIYIYTNLPPAIRLLSWFSSRHSWRSRLSRAT